MSDKAMDIIKTALDKRDIVHTRSSMDETLLFLPVEMIYITTNTPIDTGMLRGNTVYVGSEYAAEKLAALIARE